MATGDRIRYFRNLIGLTQKQLGERLGFKGKTADVRIAQYESETRVPKAKLIEHMADIFDVSTDALTVPNIDNHYAMLHTFFVLEDLYGLKIGSRDGVLCLSFDPSITPPHSPIYGQFKSWLNAYLRYESGEFDKAAYDHWRYNYPMAEARENKARISAAMRRARLEKELAELKDN